MPRTIDADALKLPSELPVDPYDDPYFRGMYSGWNNALKECKEQIDSAPTISPDDMRGLWIEDRMDYKCSACGKVVKDEIVYMLDPYQLPPFCPNCGAKMEVSEDA